MLAPLQMAHIIFVVRRKVSAMMCLSAARRLRTERPT